MSPVTAAAARDMDETADRAFDNVRHIKPAPPVAAGPDQCYTALQQSLAHYRNAGRMSPSQAQRQGLLMRSLFLKAEAAQMLEEQWQAYGAEAYVSDSYRPSRARAADVSACMNCWAAWDADGHTLYQAMLYRAECIDAEAKAVAA